jgi:hypothetical protein
LLRAVIEFSISNGVRRGDAYAVVHVPHALIRIVVNGDAM